MTVDQVVIWYNPRLGYWLMSMRLVRRKLWGRKTIKEYTCILPE